MVLQKLYTVLMYLLQPWLLLRVAWRGRLQPEYAERWPERFGFYQHAPQQPTLWVHAVSMGEVVASAPLVQALLQRYPDHQIILTTMTATGAQRAQVLHPSRVRHVYAPYDTPFAIHRFLRHFRPRLLVLFEVELWPNWLAICRAQGVPVVLLNARLSMRSTKRYLIIKSFMSRMLNQIHTIGVQHESDAARFVMLGATPERVRVLGSIKFDVMIDADKAARAQQWRDEHLGDRPVWIAASTHEGEETAVITAFYALRARWPNVLLIVVPRHPERFNRVYQLLVHSARVVKRSELRGQAVLDDVLLVDTLGELLHFYAMADVAFVGGSLIPAGGHNMLEPIALQVPVVMGPHTYNSAWMAEELVAQGGMCRVYDAASLAAAVSALLEKGAARTRQLQVASAYLASQRGVCERMLCEVISLLNQRQR
jgi:3-deoxy-D-manno-octulosonic-acid transferase